MDDPNVFEYERLDKASHEIRLITLVPGGPDDLLSLQLKHYPLAEVESRYSAFSYTWGSSLVKRAIHINDKEFWLRENAYGCLRHQRDVEEETVAHWANKYEVPQIESQASILFWMDTICINQSDTEEKDWQVAMMDRIFASAQKVLIWLGMHSESNKIAQSYLRYLRAERDCQSPRYLGDLVDRAKAMWTAKSMRGGAAARSHEKEAAVAALSPLLQDMLLADYWERLWIVQEIILAKSALILAGSVRIDFAKMPYLLGPWTRTMELSPALTFAMKLFENHMTKGSNRPATKLVEYYRSQKCYDHRDRIYGILGLSKDLKGLTVNYQECSELLFARVIRQLIENEPHRTNFMIKDFPALCQALGITSQGIFRALKDVNREEAELLRHRDILVEITCGYILQSLQCERASSRECPQELSGLYEPGDQHITLPAWPDKQPHCFTKTLARPQTVSDVLDQPSPDHTLLCSMTDIRGRFILAVDESGSLRIQQCFTYDWKADPLPRKYMARFQVQPTTACTFSVKTSPADLVLLYESLDAAQNMSRSDTQLLDHLLSLELETPQSGALVVKA